MERRMGESTDTSVFSRHSSHSLTRRGFCAAAAASALLFLAPGCTSSRNVVVDDTDVDAAAVQLTFFGFKYEPLNVIAIEEALHGYMDENDGVSIVYESIKSLPYFDALDKRLAAGLGDDVFMVDHDTVLEFEAAGYLADLSDLATISSFSELALSQMRSEGAIDYVPTSISAFGLYCNTDMLAAYGVSVPRTFAEFERACEKFVAEGVLPVVANNDISLKTVAIARGLADVYDSADPTAAIVSFNDDHAGLVSHLREGFEVVERMISGGWADAGLALETEKTADDLSQFATGAYPFMLTGAWASVRMHDLAPDLEFDVHPYPVLDDRSVLVVNVDTRVSVNANGPHVEQAKDFVTYLTRPGPIELFANSQCSFSPLIGNAAPDDGSLAPIAAAFESGVTVIGSDDNLHLPIWSSVRECVAALLEGRTAEEAEALLAELIATASGQGGESV